MHLHVDKYDQFQELAAYKREDITDEVLNVVTTFHESNELEELLLNTLIDPNKTPHGPTEIADILTVHLTYQGESGIAAFILKGRSFPTVRPKHVSHQIFRLRQISDLKFAIFGHVGVLLDEAKEEFIKTAEDLDTHYTILDPLDIARIAIHQGLLCPRDGNRIKNKKCICGYRADGDFLNELQQDAIHELEITRSFDQNAGVVILPTGGGKTRIAAVDSKKFSAKKILYIAHTYEILDVAEKEFGHVYGQERVIRGWKRNLQNETPVVRLSTIQSTKSKLHQVDSEGYDYIVIDEFHHAAAKSYRKLIASTKPNFLLGLTATPFRGDRQDVIEICGGNVVVNYELLTGITKSILVPYKYYGLFDDVDYSKIVRYAHGYSIKDLNKALIIPERDSAIIEKWREYAENLASIAFCCSHKHAERMNKSFNDSGIPSAVYLGDTPLDQRAELIEKLKQGVIKVLCVVDVLNEGADIPFVECLLFLRPTESKRIFLQQLGRGLRKYPGKENILVLDFIGNFKNAYQIIDYLGLDPEEYPEKILFGKGKLRKETLELPLNCEVNFDNKVIDIFVNQVLDPKKATRENISKILLYYYHRTSKRLGRPAKRKELDRLQSLHSGLYTQVFGSWESFEKEYAKLVEN